MVLNEEQWIKELREKRIAYGISQGRLALASGITREYLNKIESGKMKPSKELLETLHKELARFNPEAPLTMLFDYVKIRFPTLDIQHIIKDILKLNINYMLHEDYGHYSYTEHYSLGDIFIYTSADEEKGVLLELKGRGCRQFESYLLAQQRSWYDFLMDALVDGGVMKRIDLAINDHTGILDIPELAEKCRKREYIGKSRSYKFYQSGELIKHREDDREYMGRTLYLGSLKSDVYFCIYEKDYEQYVKLGTPLEEADIINRFEIQITWFVITEFIIILFGDIPPLSMIKGAFLKYFGIPVALTWFMSQKTFDGKKPYCFLKSQITYALRPKITYAGKAVKLHKQILNKTITAVRSVNYVPDKIY